MKATFKSTIQGLRHHDGIVNIISKYDDSEYEIEEVGQMWLCESNGETFPVFDDELTFDK